MTSMYFDPVTFGFYDKNIHVGSIPEGSIPLSEEEYIDLLKGQERGLAISVSAGKVFLQERVTDFVSVERAWRNAELLRSDIELNKVQDSDAKAKGSVSQWREYRKNLRAWPESSKFPNKEFRPSPPDYME